MKFYMLFFCCGLLSSCASLNSEFDCSKKPFTLCKSLDQVNHMIDDGELTDDENAPCCSQSSSHHSLKNNYPIETKNSYFSHGSLRTPETILKIWLAPYEDANENYHQASEILIVTQKAHWLNKEGVRT